MGRTPTAAAPAMTIMMDMTLAKIGCSMKNFEIIRELPSGE
jgi:hypothetical protein